LCNLYSYMFRRFRIIIREFKNQCLAKVHTFFKLKLLEFQQLARLVNFFNQLMHSIDTVVDVKICVV